MLGYAKTFDSPEEFFDKGVQELFELVKKRMENGPPKNQEKAKKNNNADGRVVDVAPNEQ